MSQLITCCHDRDSGIVKEIWLGGEYFCTHLMGTVYGKKESWIDFRDVIFPMCPAPF